VARKKVNKKLTLEEFLEKKKVILTALAFASEDNIFLQASTDAFGSAATDCYSPSQFDSIIVIDDDNVVAG